MTDSAMSIDASPGVKRRRLDGAEETQSSVGPSERYKDLWLNDGNIILQCPEGAFRVHRSLLATQSEVFRDMFTLPTPTSVAGTEDKVPAVQLSEDTGKMYMFLRYLLLHE